MVKKGCIHAIELMAEYKLISPEDVEAAFERLEPNAETCKRFATRKFVHPGSLHYYVNGDQWPELTMWFRSIGYDNLGYTLD
jgi:hypothetical protein